VREAVGAVLDVRAPQPGGLSRLVSWSFAIHLTVAAAVLLWQAWLMRSAQDDKVMTISLAGAPGPPTGGATPLGGKQVDQVAPEPKRPEPAPVVEPPKTQMSLPSKPTVTKPPVVTKDPGPQTSSVVQRPPAASQVSTGSSVIDTGVRGTGAGLAQGGGGGSQVDPEFLFCCPTYLTQMEDAIRKNITWSIGQGTVAVRFVVAQDGTIALGTIKIDMSSGVTTVDNDAIFAIRKTQLPPLPKEYNHPSLTVKLTIKY
jgi:TonB family protein